MYVPTWNGYTDFKFCTRVGHVKFSSCDDYITVPQFGVVKVAWPISTFLGPFISSNLIYLFVEKVHMKETKQMTLQLDRKVHDSNTCPTLKHKNTLQNKNTGWSWLVMNIAICMLKFRNTGMYSWSRELSKFWEISANILRKDTR